MVHGYNIKVRTISPDVVVFDKGNFPRKGQPDCQIEVTIKFVDLGLNLPGTAEIELSVVSTSPSIFRFTNGTSAFPLGTVRFSDGETKPFSFSVFNASKMEDHFPIILFISATPADAPNRSFRYSSKSDPFIYKT